MNDDGELSRKLVSLLLMVGGGMGVLVPFVEWIVMRAHGVTTTGEFVALLGLFVFVFGLSMWIGIELWRKKSRAFRWARILLIAQIPNLGVAGFAYRFYMGVTLYLLWSQRPDIVTGFEFEWGSDLRFFFPLEADGFVIGVNLVAIGALYLLAKSRASLEAAPVSILGQIGP